MLFDSNEESTKSDGSDMERDTDPGTERNHILTTEDEFLLLLMKLRLGLTNLDLAMRFRVVEATVYFCNLAIKAWPA